MVKYFAILTLFLICPFLQTYGFNTDYHKLNNTSFSKDTTIINPCDEFNELNTNIRDGQIKKSEARDLIRNLIPKIRNYYFGKGGKEFTEKDWIFPLKGYYPSAIGGTNGSGYNAGGYNYFDGNRHGGHPAHDIFIRDKNQDDLDDRTGKPVDVLSMSGGVVVSLENSWDKESGLRGGIYIWIYDPYSDALFYYAHNRKTVVNIGDLVSPGDKIAEVGRTGLNAYKKRSPTHLHFSFLEINNGDVKPADIYDNLMNSKVNE